MLPPPSSSSPYAKPPMLATLHTSSKKGDRDDNLSDSATEETDESAAEVTMTSSSIGTRRVAWPHALTSFRSVRSVMGPWGRAGDVTTGCTVVAKPRSPIFTL